MMSPKVHMTTIQVAVCFFYVDMFYISIVVYILCIYLSMHLRPQPEFILGAIFPPSFSSPSGLLKSSWESTGVVEAVKGTLAQGKDTVAAPAQ